MSTTPNQAHPSELVHVLEVDKESTLPIDQDKFNGKFVTYQLAGEVTKIVISNALDYIHPTFGSKEALRHYELLDWAQYSDRGVVPLFRDQFEMYPNEHTYETIDAGRVAYDGSTVPPTLIFKDASIDYGRGTEEQRQETCLVAQQALKDTVTVINGDGART